MALLSSGCPATGRSQHVVIGSSRSASKPVLAGVPQGSVLGPLLFLVFINDLFDVTTNNLDVFADDSTLWSIVASTAQRAAVAASLNADLTAIETWASRWLVTYNHKKTELVTFSRKRDVTSFHANGLHRDGFFLPGPVVCPHPPLIFYGVHIPERPQVKIVGVILTHNLTWGAHVDSVYRKANRSLALLRRARPVLTDKGLTTIYKSFVRSQLEYCCPLWLGAPATALARLDRIQVRAARILGHTEGIQLQSLGHRRGVAALCVMHKLLHNTLPPPLHSLAPAPLPEGRRVSARTRIPPALLPPTTRNAEFWQNSFVPRVTRAWNTLVSPLMRLIRDLHHFKKSINRASDLSFL